MSKQAVITGAADGIGRAIAAEAVQQGYTVTGIDIDETRGDEAVAVVGDGLSFIYADLSKADEVARVVDAVAAQGPIDLLINNAGINEVGYFPETNAARQELVIALNLLSPM
ncbi:MAG: SDR family oxidoreductase, partial [Chloroflexota bacterium]